MKNLNPPPMKTTATAAIGIFGARRLIAVFDGEIYSPAPSAFLCLLCLFAAILPTPAPAQTTFTATSGAHDLSNLSFDNTGAGAVPAIHLDALGVAGAATLAATNLTALAVGTGSGYRALHLANLATATIRGGTLVQDTATPNTSREYAVYLSAGARLTATGLHVEATGPRVSAVTVGNNRASTLILENSSIQNSGSVTALWMAGSGVALLTTTTITTTGDLAPAILGGNHSNSRVALDRSTLSTSGAASSAIWLGGNSESYSEFTITRSTITATGAGSAAIDINIHTPGLTSAPAYSSTTFQQYWFNNYDLHIASSTLAGAAAFLRASTAVLTTTAEPRELRTEIRLWAADSTLAGDITAAGTAQLTLALDRTTHDGALVATGTATLIVTTTNNTVITRGIALSGAATLDLDAAGATITGTLSAAGGAAAKVRLTQNTTLDAVHFSDHATLELTLDATSGVRDPVTGAPGPFTFTDGATYTLLPADNKTLTFANPLTLANAANLKIAPSTRLTLAAPLTLATPDATITITNAIGDDLTLDAGAATPAPVPATQIARLAIRGLSAAALGRAELRVIHDPTRTLAATGTLALAGPASNRLYAYHALETRPDGAYLTRGGYSTAGAAILDTPALAAATELDALDLISPEIGTGALITNPARAAHGTSAGTGTPSSGTTFLARATRVTADGATPGLAFTQHTYNLAAAADLHFHPFDNRSLLAAGLAADTARADRKFTAGDADGHSTTCALAARAAYAHPAGLRLAAALRASQTKNTLNARDPGATLSAAFTTRAIAAHLEAAWQFTPRQPRPRPGTPIQNPKSKITLTPSLSASLARLGGADYTTDSANPDNRFRVTQSAATATRLSAALAAASPLGENWLLRARLAASRLDISDGAITCDTLADADAQLAGFRADATLGLTRRLTRNAALTLDYTLTRAADYTAPWSLAIALHRAW
jgi:hypothetical protein